MENTRRRFIRSRLTPNPAQERKTESREHTNTWAISKNGDRAASAALLIVRGQLRCWFTYFKKRGRDTRQHSPRRASKALSRRPSGWPLGPPKCSRCIFEAPDDETAASVLLAADMLGNIRTQTMRAFTASEMEKILAKVP
jgi:GYD domain